MAGVFRAIFGYCFLIFMVRIAGRRPGKQATPFEYVLIFFMGGVTLTPLVGNDRSLTNALVQIAAVALTHYAIAILRQRPPLFGRFVDGTPLVLLKSGEWQVETMTKMLVSDDDVIAAARDKALSRLDQIDYAILERNGEISIIAGEEEN